MKILFTGGSSFTGLWFIRELASAGHEVIATFRSQPHEYPDELRRTRVGLALEACRGVFGCSFGDPKFLDLASQERWDLLCHHAADATNYRSPDFNVVAAVENNSRNVAGVLEALQSKGSAHTRLILTGSYFENDEGVGSEGLPAFSPYGLSKSLTYQVFRFYAARAGLTLAKFVIPNPFGPYDGPKFPAHLMKTWFAGQTAVVNTPAYVRDNIHVSLLAKVYAKFADDISRNSGPLRLNPSGYAESQGAFTLRFAGEIRSRLDLPCEVDLKRQTEFMEPRERINRDVVDGPSLGWNESSAWDEIAEYYRNLYSPQLRPARR